MARCEHCGNDYDKSFEITMRGESHTFDSFECAIHKLAPVCEHCGCKIVGHGGLAAFLHRSVKLCRLQTMDACPTRISAS